MSNSPVLLQTLGNGVLLNPAGAALNGHLIYVYERGTTTQVEVYSDTGLSELMSQPLLTGSWIVPGSGEASAMPGSVPGYVAGEQELDFYDATTGIRKPAEPVAAHDVAVIGSDGTVGGPDGSPLSDDIVQDASTHGTADWGVVKEAPLNVEWAEYGASPTATQAANVTAIAAAIAACPNGGELFFPRNYPVNGTLTVEQQITLMGVGTASGLTLNNGAADDGLVIASAGGGQLVSGVQLRSFSIVGGANSCRNALVLRDLFAPIVDGVYIQAGAAGYGASLQGVLDGHVLLLAGSNFTLPIAGSPPANGVQLIASSFYPSNANRLALYIGGIAGIGLDMDGSAWPDPGFDNSISGTIEGCTGLGIQIIDAQNWRLHDLHVEGVGTGNGITLNTSPNGTIGPGVLAGNSGGQNPLTLIASTGIEVDGSQLGTASIDSASSLRCGQCVEFTGSVSVAAGGAFTNALRSPAVSQPARSLGVAYQPSSSRDVMVVAVVGITAPGQIVAYCDGSPTPTTQRGQLYLPSTTGYGTIAFLCPAGQYYQFTQTSGTGVLNVVTEYQL